MRNEYLAAENRILRAKVKGRLQLSDGEKRTLAEVAHRLGRKALAEVAVAVGKHNGQIARIEPVHLLQLRTEMGNRKSPSRGF